MEAPVQAALIALGGVVLGLILRDALLQLYFFRKKRETELEDRYEKRKGELETIYRAELIKARDVVRLYADPLLHSCKALNYRLKEVLEQKGRATFLLPQTPQSAFVVYKRISTLYRLAALLGWIRAYRKERSYLDPADAIETSEIEKAVESIEMALADGAHVEDQRLNELLQLWVPSCPPLDEQKKRNLAIAVDNVLRAALTEEEKTSALELSENAKQKLCSDTAEILSTRLGVDIPTELVAGEHNRAIVFFGIKEAYVYREWQQAIGDLVLIPLTNSTRRFEVMGYFQFESLFLSTDVAHEMQQRWIRRLDAVFVGLEPDKKDVFDARRNQIKSVYEASQKLQKVLEAKIKQYSSLTAQRA